MATNSYIIVNVFELDSSSQKIKLNLSLPHILLINDWFQEQILLGQKKD